MVEWSGKILPTPKGKSLTKLYDELESGQHIIPALPNTLDTPPLTPAKMIAFLEKKIDDLGLKDINLVERKYVPQTWEEMEKSFRDYYRIRAAFLKMLSYSNKDECFELGFNNGDIELLKKGISPENYNTHLKVPFDFGGTLDFSNFSLVKSHPIHDRLHQLIELQISTDFLKTHKKIFIPSFEGRVYHD